MAKAYTGKGDTGYTTTFDGRVLSKDHQIIVAGGKLDALLSALDSANYLNPMYATYLEEISTKLWLISGELSGAAQAVKKEDISELEKKIEVYGQPPDQFVRFTNKGSISLNECRVRCREAESALTPLMRTKTITPEFYAYMNRLSSYFFMLAYTVEKRENIFDKMR